MKRSLLETFKRNWYFFIGEGKRILELFPALSSRKTKKSFSELQLLRLVRLGCLWITSVHLLSVFSDVKGRPSLLKKITENIYKCKYLLKRPNILIDNNTQGVARWLSRWRCLSPSLLTWVWSLGSMMEERTYSCTYPCRQSSDLHLLHVAPPPPP